jgi:hypothetical protein
MGLVPFKTKTKPATYAAPSGPRSKGRMPTTNSTPAIMRDTGPDSSKTTPAPEVDGGLRGHDRNYSNPASEKN